MGGPHPVIVAIQDNKDYIRVLLHCYYTTITGWGGSSKDILIMGFRPWVIFLGRCLLGNEVQAYLNPKRRYNNSSKHQTIAQKAIILPTFGGSGRSWAHEVQK